MWKISNKQLDAISKTVKKELEKIVSSGSNKMDESSNVILPCEEQYEVVEVSVYEEQYANAAETAHIEMDCVVQFRPKKGWQGEDYGFDWMRIGDWGDVPYKDIVSEHRSRTKKSYGVFVLEDDPNAYNGKFNKDEESFQKLEAEYNAFNAYSDKRTGNKSFKYYCPWLSLYPEKVAKRVQMTQEEIDAERGYTEKPNPFTPISQNWHKTKLTYVASGYTNTKATLSILVDVAEAPDYLEFEKNENFDIFPMRMTVNKGMNQQFYDDIDITCLKDFFQDQEIAIYAYKKDAKTKQTKKQLAGKLYVWANAGKPQKAKVVMIEVKTPPISDPKEKSIGVANKNLDFNKYLRQAQVEAQLDKVESLDLTDDNEFKDGGRYVINNMIKSTVDQGIISHLVFGSDQLHDYLYNKLQKQLEKAGEDKNKYINHFKLFYFGEPESKGKGGYSSNDKIVFYVEKRGELPNDVRCAHELFHSFGLAHTFSNKVAHPGADYTYEAFKTDNIMDYSHLKKLPRYSISHWQWVTTNKGTRKTFDKK